MKRFEIILYKQTPAIKTEVNVKSQKDLTLIKEFCSFGRGVKECAGLAANQVTSPDTGRISKRFFAMFNGRDTRAFINPKILAYRGHDSIMHEGCKTWPGKRIIAHRCLTIEVEYHTFISSVSSAPNTELKTEYVKELLTGWTAQVFQHEMDHLNGVEEKFSYQGNKKVGRNEPCPCKSGLKFKRCCGQGK